MGCMAHNLSHTAAPAAAKTASAAVLTLEPRGRFSSEAFTCGSSNPRARAYSRHPLKTAAVSGFRVPRVTPTRLMREVVSHNGLFTHSKRCAEHRLSD